MCSGEPARPDSTQVVVDVVCDFGKFAPAEPPASGPVHPMQPTELDVMWLVSVLEAGLPREATVPSSPSQARKTRVRLETGGLDSSCVVNQSGARCPVVASVDGGFGFWEARLGCGLPRRVPLLFPCTSYSPQNTDTLHRDCICNFPPSSFLFQEALVEHFGSSFQHLTPI